METITNAASTVSNLIYGQPAKNGETAGKEPVSGEQGKGTAAEPFDKGNVETPGVETAKSDEFLKLSPDVAKTTATDSSTGASTGATTEPAMPVVPLNPDAAASGGATDKAGVSDHTYKETPLDDIKLSGAPGAGPTAPEVTPAAGETSKPTEQASTEAKTETPKDSSTSKTQPIDSKIDAVLGKGPDPSAKHDVDEREAQSPHSKMNEKTARQTDSSQTGESGGLSAENAGGKSESSKSTDRTSSTGGEEKSSSKKMSALKEKLKDKLHIGSKDK